MNQDKALLTITQHGGVTVVGFPPSCILDHTNVEALGIELMELLEVGDRTRILLDMAGVRHVSSCVIGKLVGLQKKMALLNGELKLCTLELAVQSTFLTMRLDRVFEIHQDNAKALAAFRGAMIG